MENVLENIERIMKPYYDKQEEIKMLLNQPKEDRQNIKDSIKELKEKRQIEKRKLEMRLEHLKDNKEREIAEYIEQIYLSNLNVSPVYIQMVRKDLEQAYQKQEDDFKAEIKKFNEKTEAEIAAMEELNEIKNRPNYKRVYNRELFDIRYKLEQELLIEKKKLENELKLQSANFSVVMNELNNFKHEYDEHHRPINGSKFKELFDKSSDISSRISEIKKGIEKINIYLGEVSVMTLTPEEQEEYDRRNKVLETVTVEEIKITEEPVVEENFETEQSVVEDSNLIEEDVVATEEPVVVEDNETIEEPVVEENAVAISTQNEQITEEKLINFINDDIKEVNEEIAYNVTYDGANFSGDSYSDLLKFVYDEIVSQMDNLHSLKLNESNNLLKTTDRYLSSKENSKSNYEVLGRVNLGNSEDTINLPSGQYIYEDFEDALIKYYEKRKDRTLHINSTNTKLKMNSKSLEKCREALKRCSTIKLFSENKISNIDLRRVFGKAKSKEYEIESKEKQLGKIHTSMKEGNYINRNEVIASLKFLLEPTFISKVKNQFQNLFKKEEVENSTEQQLTKTK